MISWAGWWIQTPSATPLQLNKWNAYFWIMFNIWWWAGLIDGLKPHPPPLSSQKMKCWLLDYVYLLMIRQAGQWTWAPSNTHQPKEWNAHFWITFTSVDGLGWLIDSNPICHPSPAKKMKCSFLDYVQHLMISRTDQWTRIPSATPLQPKWWNANFCIMLNF